MTLAEIANHVVSTVGQSDSISVAICKDYVKRNYAIVWDAFDWKDTRHITSLSYTAGTSVMTLPAEIDRVIAVSRNEDNAFLDPIDAVHLAETTGTTLNSSATGTPTMYEELATGAGVHTLRLYPAPSTATTVLIVGKRVRPELSSDSSSPIIRGIDNVLIALTMADMLARLRQVGKSNNYVEKAKTLLDAAVKLETEQSNRPRRAKNLTASGNTLGEMADDVCARIGDFKPETYILVKQFLRRNYQQLYDSYLWKESRVVARKASDGTQLVCPEYFGRVTALRANEDLGLLAYVEAEYLATTQPTIFEETTGTQFGFTQMSDVAVHTLPPGYEKLSISSTSASDVGTVFIFGESNGAEVRETITLTGTTPVLTANFYNIPLTITKPAATVGNVVVNGATSGAELVRIMADERERKHIRLWLHPANSTSTTCLILGKRKIRPLFSDHDTPLLRDAHNYIIEAATAESFARFGKPNEAGEYRQKAEASRKILMSLETAQGINQMRVVPSVEPSGYCDYSYGKASFLA